MNTSWVLHLLYTMILTRLSDSFSISLQVKDAWRRRQAEMWSCQAVAKRETLTRSTLLTRVLTGLNIGLISTFNQPDRSRALESDEFEEIFEEQAIGIELQDVRYKGSSRVIIKRVFEGGAAATRPRMKSNLVLVSANGKDLERENAVAAKEIIKTSSRPLTLVLRDADTFTELLTSDRGQSAYRSDDATLSFQPVTTRVAPEGTGQEEQLLKVLSTTKSSMCESCKGARRGDLLEIEYTGRLQDGKVFDGSNIKVNGREVVGRGGDTSLFFVLGKQPTGQFPPGWDIMLVGMCVGERRVISVPPLLGYGAQGLPRRGVPPNSTLVYDVKLVGVNGVNMCTS